MEGFLHSLQYASQAIWKRWKGNEDEGLVVLAENMKEKNLEIIRLLSEWNCYLKLKDIFELHDLKKIQDEEMTLLSTTNEEDIFNYLAMKGRKIAFLAKQTSINNYLVDLSGLLLDNGDFFTEDSFNSIGETIFVEKYKGHSVTLFHCLFFLNGKEETVFKGKVEGNIVEVGGESRGWDCIFAPINFSKTLSQMNNQKFVTSGKWKPYLEFASCLRNHPYEGLFEVHITVENQSKETEEEFKQVCEVNKCKAIMISLPSGISPKQLMTSSYYSGSFHHVQEKAFKLGERIAQSGFNITRLKVEAMISNKGVPITDEEAQNLSTENYFEFHIKVTLYESEIDELKEICKKHDAHLSKNAFRTLANSQSQRFVTQRMYQVGKKNACDRFEACLEEIKQAGFEVSALLKEYSVYDSNVKLDAGWIEKTEETPSHKRRKI